MEIKDNIASNLVLSNNGFNSVGEFVAIQNSQMSKPHLNYYGGKILSAPKFASIYYGSYWNTKRGKAEREYNDKFSSYIVTSPHTTIWAEYGVGKGKYLGSVVTADKLANPGSDKFIRALIDRELSLRHLPKEDGQTVYTVYLPPGMILTAPDGSTSKQGLGGYHMSFTGQDGKKTYYAAIVYSNKTNGIDFNGRPRDDRTIVTSHEWTEAVTDPDVNNGKLGWYDYNYGEVGDIPINMGLPLREVYDRLNGYAVQKEWSNKDNTNEIVE